MSRKLWTAEETRALRTHWRKVPAAILAELLPRWGWYSIYDKAWKLRLPMGAPKGCQSLNGAAKRAGYDRKGFKSLLERQGVPIQRGYNQSCAEDSLRAYVNVGAADRAVAADLKAESFRKAATRLHVDARRFARFVKRMGYRIVRGRDSKLRPELLDKLATEYKAAYQAKRRAHGLALGKARAVKKSRESRRAA